MKRLRKIAYLLAGSLLLSSCDFLSNLASYLPAVSSTSESSVGVSLQDGGTEITLAEGLSKAEAALEATAEKDYIGFSLSIPNFEYHGADLVYQSDVNPDEGEGNESVTTADCLNKNLVITNLSAEASASGLTSTEHAGLSAEASVSADELLYEINH